MTGATMAEQLPHGRGYDTSFGYLNHANYYYKNTLYSKEADCGGVSGRVVDLWNTTQPAYGHNNSGVYEEFLFANEVYKQLDNAAKDPDTPFFIFYASHISHVPNEVPKEYLSTWTNDENECHEIQWPVYPGFNTSNPDNYHCRSITQSQSIYWILLLEILQRN